MNYLSINSRFAIRLQSNSSLLGCDTMELDPPLHFPICQFVRNYVIVLGGQYFIVTRTHITWTGSCAAQQNRQQGKSCQFSGHGLQNWFCFLIITLIKLPFIWNSSKSSTFNNLKRKIWAVQRLWRMQFTLNRGSNSRFFQAQNELERQARLRSQDQQKNWT